MMRQTRADVLVTDFRMSGMSGLDLLLELRGAAAGLRAARW